MTSTLLAKIDEQACIGCARCLPACPVDAILGAAGQMHTVIKAACIGCGLCLPPCPMDCISLIEAPTHQVDKTLIKKNVLNRKKRLNEEQGHLGSSPPSLEEIQAELKRLFD